MEMKILCIGSDTELITLYHTSPRNNLQPNKSALNHNHEKHDILQKKAGVVIALWWMNVCECSVL